VRQWLHLICRLSGIGDASTNIVRLGKVLDNPIKSLNSLTRAGIVFTGAEKNKITALIKSGKLQGAQDLILKKIEGRMGGTAKATTTSSEKMKVAWHSVQVKLGKAFLPLIERLAHFIGDVLVPSISTFIEQHPDLVKWIGIGAAALLGLGLAAKVVAFSMTLIQLASGPVGLIILGIAALAFVLIKWWKPISGFFAGIWNGIINIFSKTWHWIKSMFLNYTPAGLIFKHWSKIKGFSPASGRL
jgi:hypothetical protein